MLHPMGVLRDGGCLLWEWMPRRAFYSSLGGGGDGVSVSGVVTANFFNGIISQARGGCAGRNFYSRSAFLNAAKSYSQFDQGGSVGVKSNIWVDILNKCELWAIK